MPANRHAINKKKNTNKGNHLPPAHPTNPDLHPPPRPRPTRHRLLERRESPRDGALTRRARGSGLDHGRLGGRGGHGPGAELAAGEGGLLVASETRLVLLPATPRDGDAARWRRREMASPGSSNEGCRALATRVVLVPDACRLVVVVVVVGAGATFSFFAVVLTAARFVMAGLLGTVAFLPAGAGAVRAAFLALAGESGASLMAGRAS